ncbi:hypothetical protein VTK26DRAFT_7330 [Humicola hyalothermophila]
MFRNSSAPRHGPRLPTAPASLFPSRPTVTPDESRFDPLFLAGVERHPGNSAMAPLALDIWICPALPPARWPLPDKPGHKGSKVLAFGPHSAGDLVACSPVLSHHLSPRQPTSSEPALERPARGPGHLYFFACRSTNAAVFCLLLSLSLATATEWNGRRTAKGTTLSKDSNDGCLVLGLPRRYRLHQLAVHPI